MSKRTIFVGKEYKQAFESISALISGNCFDGLPYSVDGKVISDGVYEYQLSSSQTKSEKQKFVFEKDGASWFKALRGEKTPDDDAIWNTFRSNVALEYHKRFSVVEYKKQAFSREEQLEALEKAKEIANNLFTAIYGDFASSVDVVSAKDLNAVEDIYGVAMKIELSGGTGASVPVLGKVYFTRTGKVMRPALSSAVAQIDASINAVIPEEGDSDTALISTTVLDNALDAMQALIEDKDKNFADYLCLGDKIDQKAVKGMLDKLSHDAIELECQRVDILYVTHFQATAYEFIVSVHGKPALKIQLGMGGAVSVYCENCLDKPCLIERNVVTYTNSNKERCSIRLDFDREDLGLDNKALQELKDYSALKEHIKSSPCKAQGKVCPPFKCKNQTFETSYNGNVIICCKDCPYPDVVYTSYSGEKLYTPSLKFAFDKMELVKEDAENPQITCKICGRAFSSSVMNNGKCPTCAKMANGDLESARKLYRKYREYLPISARFNFTNKKYCFEDSEIILFVINEKRYVFNKLNVKEYGYMPKPKSVK